VDDLASPGVYYLQATQKLQIGEGLTAKQSSTHKILGVFGCGRSFDYFRHWQGLQPEG